MALNLAGQRFTRLLVISRVGSKHGHTTWFCRCDCGAEKIFHTGALRSGHAKSCGCWGREQTSKRMAARCGTKNPSWKGGPVLRARRKMQKPAYRLRVYLRNRLGQALRGEYKSARTLELLGCTIEFLREHLEKQFVPGMTWENYGPVWHVDHILPCAEFHLQHSEEQEICFHWTNLQPLFAKDNLSKGDKII